MAKAPFVSEKDKEAFWHSTSHILADAVKRLWPDVKLGIGPAIDEGFYYDFDKKVPFTEADLIKIEAEMKKIVKEDKLFKQVFMTRKEAEKLLAKETFKLELLKEIKDKKIEFHQHGNFIDLCNNTLVKSAGQIKAFKLLNTAAAYWRGDSKKPVLQRIYGISFPEKEQLGEFLKVKAEAEKRDHRVIGKQLKLFAAVEQIGTGLPLLLPHGATIRRVLERYIVDLELANGYQHVYTPVLARTDLYKTSGHWQHYRESMYPPMKVDTEELVLRPMNCPHHIHIFKHEVRSYKELPMRIAEIGAMFRYEASGALTGLARVRQMNLDDSHIFCTEKQIKSEIENAINLNKRAYADLGLSDKISYRLSLRDPKDKVKYVQNESMWNLAEDILRKIMKELKLKFVEAIGEAAFYGPKIDVQLKNVLGHEESVATVQLDFHLPEKFDLTYTGEDNKQHRVVMIHRGGISTMERMMSFLIEHYAGAFPVWLAPVQVKLLTFTDRNQKYAEKIEAELKNAGLRVETDYENNTVEYKVRQAEMEKVPAILVCGDKEEKLGTVAVRWRGTSKVKYGVKVEDFIREIRELIEKRM
jgi:threonyl-tRNA synthetase